MVWYGMVWYGMVWYGMVWYGMADYTETSIDKSIPKQLNDTYIPYHTIQVKLYDRAKERDVFYSIVRQLDSIENKAKPDVEISQIQVWNG